MCDIRGNGFKKIHCLFPLSLIRLTLGALGLKLNDYWKEVTEKKAREREFQALDKDENVDEHDTDESVSTVAFVLLYFAIVFFFCLFVFLQ